MPKKNNNTTEVGNPTRPVMLRADNAWKEQNIRKIDKIINGLNEVKNRILAMKEVRVVDAFAMRNSFNKMVDSLPKINYCSLKEGESYEEWWL